MSLLNAGLIVIEGKLKGMKVKVLRDSGCTCVVVNRKLIKDKMLTGEMCDLKTISGEVIMAPRAKVNIECEYFKGIVNAVCVCNPIVDVIIGEVKGASEVCFINRSEIMNRILV